LVAVAGMTATQISLDDVVPQPLTFKTPVKTLREVSYDIDLARRHELADGHQMSALEVQWEYLELARKYAESHGLEVVGGDAIGSDVLDRWEHMLSALESDPMSLADQVDWIAKRRLYEGFVERHGIGWDDTKLAALDLQYHDLRPDKCLARRIGLQRITDDADVGIAVDTPPATTRAYFRGRCLDKFPDQIVAANWDSMVFDAGGDPLRRVPMLEPLRGTEAHVGTLLDDCDDAAELLRRLGS
jgi:Pup amidohydrolase